MSDAVQRAKAAHERNAVANARDALEADWAGVIRNLIDDVETLELQLPPVGSVTFPPGCEKYQDALRLGQGLGIEPNRTCATCKHWDREGIEYCGKRKCAKVQSSSDKFEDNGPDGTFEPITAPDFGCTEWEERQP